MSRRLRSLILILAVTALMPIASSARQTTPQTPPGRGQAAPPTPTLGLENGTLDFDTPDFTLKLVKDSQTIAALQPKGAKGMDANTPFDFTPADQLTARQGDRFNHLGDIHLAHSADRMARRRVGRSGVEQRAQAGRRGGELSAAARIDACSRPPI